MTSNNLDIIFDEWKVNLQTKDRSSKAVLSNFDELFMALKNAGATFEQAQVFVSKAAKAHQPPSGLARSVYKQFKIRDKYKDFSEKEFIDQWNNNIADHAGSVFYSIFPRPMTAEEEGKGKTLPGGMTADEYRLQRKLSSKFRRLDTEALEKRLQTGEFLSLEEMKSILGSEDGNTK